MNLFHNTTLIQAMREAYDLSVPQAQVVLLAFQHQTISSITAQIALKCDAKRLSSVAALSGPVRKKLLMEVGKVRMAQNKGRPTLVYRLTDSGLQGVTEVITQTGDANMALFLNIVKIEKDAQEKLQELNHGDQ